MLGRALCRSSSDSCTSMRPAWYVLRYSVPSADRAVGVKRAEVAVSQSCEWREATRDTRVSWGRMPELQLSRVLSRRKASQRPQR